MGRTVLIGLGILLGLSFYGRKALAQAVCVKVASTTLRAEPRVSAAATWVVGKYTPLLRVDRQNGWIKVQDMDGDTHWVQRNAVSSDLHCLSVRAATTHLRQGPGKLFPTVEHVIVDRYTAFKRLESEEEWYQVEDVNGVKGWLHDSVVWRPTLTQSISF